PDLLTLLDMPDLLLHFQKIMAERGLTYKVGFTGRLLSFLHLEKVAKAFSPQYWKNLSKEHFLRTGGFLQNPFCKFPPQRAAIPRFPQSQRRVGNSPAPGDRLGMTC
ncbi:MAG: hypothetical protein ACLQDI_16145, partial [Syntrophobacteraceae bacterium]